MSFFPCVSVGWAWCSYFSIGHNVSGFHFHFCAGGKYIVHFVYSTVSCSVSCSFMSQTKLFFLHTHTRTHKLNSPEASQFTRSFGNIVWSWHNEICCAAGDYEADSHVTSWILAKQEEQIWPTRHVPRAHMDHSALCFTGTF